MTPAAQNLIRGTGCSSSTQTTDTFNLQPHNTQYSSYCRSPESVFAACPTGTLALVCSFLVCARGQSVLGKLAAWVACTIASEEGKAQGCLGSGPVCVCIAELCKPCFVSLCLFIAGEELFQSFRKPAAKLHFLPRPCSRREASQPNGGRAF